MSTHNMHFHDKIKESPKISLNFCFLALWDKFPWDLKASSNQPW